MWMEAIAAALTLATSASRIPNVEQLTLTSDRVATDDRGGSSSSHDQDTIIIRTVVVHAGGIELEYDLPATATKQERAFTWQFPLRVFRPTSGPARLVDRAALQSRVTAWLKMAELPRTSCGHTIFTWNAFRIECEPEAALATVAAFDFNAADLRDGALYHDEDGQGPAPLARRVDASGLHFDAKLALASDAVRRAKAELDVGVGEITGKPTTFERALANHAGDVIAGGISVTFDVDADGKPQQRTRTVKMTVTANGRTENSTVTQVLSRSQP